MLSLFLATTAVAVDLRVAATEIPVWGCLPIEIELANEGADSLPWCTSMLRGGCGDLRVLVEIRPPEGDVFVAYAGEYHYPSRSVERGTIEPGASMEFEGLLTGEQSRYIRSRRSSRWQFQSFFEEPGRYEIVAVCQQSPDSSGSLVQFKSRPALVSVIAPTDDQRESLGIFRQMKHASYVYHPERLTLPGARPDAEAELVRMAESRPASHYADSARFALATWHFRLGTNYYELSRPLADSKEHLRLAKEYLSAIELPSFVLSGRCERLANRLREEAER